LSGHGESFEDLILMKFDIAVGVDVLLTLMKAILEESRRYFYT
jgi:hypothetical protein